MRADARGQRLPLRLLLGHARLVRLALSRSIVALLAVGHRHGQAAREQEVAAVALGHLHHLPAPAELVDVFTQDDFHNDALPPISDGSQLSSRPAGGSAHFRKSNQRSNRPSRARICGAQGLIEHQHQHRPAQQRRRGQAARVEGDHGQPLQREEEREQEQHVVGGGRRAGDEHGQPRQHEAHGQGQRPAHALELAAFQPGRDRGGPGTAAGAGRWPARAARP